MKRKTAVEQFNGLNGSTASRATIKRLIAKAKQEEQPEVVERLQRLLDENKESDFDISVRRPAVEVAPESLLSCIDCEIEDDEPQGLGRAVSPNDVYQMVTDRILPLIKEAKSSDYQKRWSAGIYGKGYLLAFNFVSRRAYRGVNYVLLTNFKVLKNPFFLTFKQVEELGGKIKKDSKAHPVVYFTKLYQVGKYRGYDAAAAEKEAVDNGGSWLNVKVIPILKYYNVFNGEDIEGIDFDLDNFKVGYINVEKPSTEDKKLTIPESIIRNYPKPQPKISFGGDRAYYAPSSDSLRMPHIYDFETPEHYYRVFFHELSHSTGHPKRLKREFGAKKTKQYAFEELVAEWGAVFISAWAGIVWNQDRDHATYLAMYNRTLTAMKQDNRYIMRACTAAQRVADFVLSFDDKGNPAFFADLPKVKPARKPKSSKDSKPKIKHNPSVSVKNKKRAKKAVLSVKDRQVKQKSNRAVDKNRLDQVNPKPFAIKPKSTSVKTAINDVFSTGKYPDVKPIIGQILFRHFGNLDAELRQNDYVDLTSDFEKKVLYKDQYLYADLYDFYESDSTLAISQRGMEFVNAVKARLESLRNQKHNYAMFDGLKGVEGAGSTSEQKQPINELPKPETQTAPPRNVAELDELGFVSADQVPDKPENVFVLPGQIGLFLQTLQRYMALIIIKGPKHTSKSQLAMQIASAIGEMGELVAYIDAEQGGLQCKDTIDSINRNTSPEGRRNIKVVGSLADPFNDLKKLAKHCFAVVADSVTDLGITADQLNDLRKQYPETVWVFISQVKEGGEMYGGGKMAHNPTVIIECHPSDNPAHRFATLSKNRGNDLTLRYSMFTQSLIQDIEEEDVEESDETSIDLPFRFTERKVSHHEE